MEILEQKNKTIYGQGKESLAGIGPGSRHRETRKRITNEDYKVPGKKDKRTVNDD